MVASGNGKYTISQLTLADIPKIVGLSAYIGWDYTETDLTTIFESGLVFGHKTEDGDLISTGAIFPYDHTFSSLGMIIVHPDYRGLQLGKHITLRCINHYQDLPVMLVATEQGVPLYTKIGFKKVDHLYKLIAENYDQNTQIKCPPYTIRGYQHTDFAELAKLDRSAFGAARDTFLRARLKQSADQSVLIDSKGIMVGYGLRIELPDMQLIGPIIAPNAKLAEWLIHSLLIDYSGKVRIDIPSKQRKLVDVLNGYGFEIVNQPPIMLLHAEQFPPRDQSLFAIAAQAFG